MRCSSVVPAVREGRVRHTETVVHAIDNAPQAFRDVLSGRDVGKTPVPP